MTIASGLAGKTCVVLGAGGFIGRHLVSELLDHEADVRVFGRGVGAFAGLPVSLRIESDLAETENLKAAVRGADIVFHLINSTSPATAEDAQAFDISSNLIGTVSLLSICRDLGVERVVFASSGGTVYGASDRHLLAEDVAPNPISSYGITKLSLEKYMYLYNHSYGMRNVVLRVSNPFGPFQLGRKSQGVIGAFMRAARRGQAVQVWGKESVRDYIYVGDVAAAFVAAALYEGERHLFNIGTGIGVTLGQVIGDIERVSDVTLDKTYHPARLFDVARSVLDIGAAKAHLGWEPRADWDRALRHTWQWVCDADTATGPLPV